MMSTQSHSHSTQLAPVDAPFERVGTRLRAQHPLVLPSHVCVRCGSREPGGSIHDDWVTYASPWIWLTIFVSWLITAIAYLATRKRMQVQYYLCPACSDRRKIRRVTTALVAAVAFGGLAVAIGMESLPFMGLFGGVLFVAFFARVAAVAPPLRAIGHKDGRFLLKGASPRFLHALEARLLDHDRRS